MHVLVISRSFPQHRHGGMEQHAQDVVDGLMAAGHRVSVLTTPFPSEEKAAPLAVNGELIVLGKKSGAYDLPFVKDFSRRGAREVTRIQPDIIHAQGFAGIAAERYLRGIAPIITTLHGTLWSETPLREGGGGTLPDLWRFKHRFIFQPLWKKFLQRDPQLIVDSQFTVKELERELRRPLKHAPTVIPLGFQTDRIERAAADRKAARAGWGIADNQILFASIGRLTRIKNFQLIVEGFSRFSGSPERNTRLIIAGEGPEKNNLPRLNKTAEALCDSRIIQLPGSVSQDRAAELLAAADLFVNADGGTPAFGLANAEALVAGTPVLTFDTGAHREVVADGDDGELIPPDNLGAFTAAMKRWAEELPEAPETRLARAERAQRRFARSLMIERLLAAYTAAGAKV